MHTRLDLHPHRIRRTWAGLAACSLVLAACGGGDDTTTADAPDAPDADAAPAATEPSATDPSATEPSGTAPGSTEPESTAPAASVGDVVRESPDEAPGDGTTAASPAPIVGTELAWTESGAEWDITFEGFVETDRSNPDDGKCASLFGTATLQSLPDGLWNTSLQQPQFGLLLGGEYVKPKNNGCSDEVNAAQGYRYDSRLEVIAGTTFPFVAQFQLDDAALADAEALVVGAEAADVQHFLHATAVTAVPAGQPAAGDLSALAVRPLDVISTDATQGQHDVTVLGLVATPATDGALTDEGAGSCVSVITTMTATALTDGAVTDATPSIGLIADGQLLAALGGDCELAPIRDAGFQTVSNIRLTPGTSIDLATNIFVPDALADADLTLAVSLLPQSATQLFALDLPVSDDFPAPAAPADASVLPTANGPMMPGPITYAPDPEDTTWTIDAPGLVDGGLTADGRSQCWYAPMTVTPSADESFPPQMSVISDGQAIVGSNGCAAEDLRAAGWTSFDQLDFTAGTAQAGYASFGVPVDSAGSLQQFVIGALTTDELIIVRDATLLTAVPAP